MADEVKRIEVDIGAAAAMLQNSPELCTMMNELVGGPALVEAHAEVDRLHDLLCKISREQLRIASLATMTRPAMREAAMETHNEIVAALKFGK